MKSFFLCGVIVGWVCWCCPAGAQSKGEAAGSHLATASFRTPLSEAGQSGVCLSGERLFLTVHKQLDGELKNGFTFSSDIVGQCFDRHTGALLWQVDLPGSYAGLVLESWHDATSLNPVANDKYVVFHNLNGMLGCYTLDGKPVWERRWQAPDPDIKNCRMFLDDETVIVGLPSDKIAVKADATHPDLPFYQLHGIELASGRVRWRSPVLLHHAAQYSLDRWRDQPVIVTSMLDLSHWKFGMPRVGYLLSPEDGRVLREFKLPPANPHQKNQLCDGRFLVTSPAGTVTMFELVDVDTSTELDTVVQRTFRIEQPDTYFAWNGSRYESAPFERLFTDVKTLRDNGQPTPSTVHVVGKRIYFWRYDTSAIGCVEVDSGTTNMIQAPLQVRADGTAWRKSEFRFTPGIQNAAGNVVNQRVGTPRGIERGGFGHTNPAWPVLHDKKLYWLNGAGVLYIIDTTKPLGPDAFDWLAISPTGDAWTYGSPAVDDEAIYVRSQRELVRINR